MADHMAGINALPRWDPNNLDKGYSYDWRNYDREAREDRAKFVEARRERDKARNVKAQADLKKAMKDAAQAVKDKIDSAMQEAGLLSGDDGDVLEILTPSTCFKSVTWEADEPGSDDGQAVGEFHRGGDLVYSGPMTRAEFLEWADDQSVGGWYNAVKPF